MIEDIANLMIDRLFRKEVIAEEDLEIYQYGIINILEYIFNIVPAIIISIVLREWWQGILFTVVFASLRTYAGGYHATTMRKCFVLSMGVFTTSLLVMKYLDIPNFICWSLLIISDIIIIFLTPVEAINKSIDEVERKLYRRKSIIIVCVETVAAVVLMILGNKEIALCIILAMVAVGGSMVAGKIRLNAYMEEMKKMHG